MSWLTFIAAAVKILPLLLDLVSRFKASADAKAAQGVGYEQAVADGVKLMLSQLEEADKAVAEAKERHQAHPNDDRGFDTQFRRD